ncbi:MAG: hypothetical protein AAFZ18_36975 [Myxococcota bacterium]
MRTASLSLTLFLASVGCSRGCGRTPEVSSPEVDPLASLGLAGTAGCPFDAWVVGDLPSGFDCTGLDSGGVSAVPVGSLGGFCRVTLSAAVRAEDVQERIPDGARMAPDCVVVQPLLGSGGTAATREAGLDGMGRPHAKRGSSFVPASRVVVLGDAATSTAADWFDRERGSAAEIGALIRDLVCPAGGQGCSAEVASVRALPREDPRDPKALRRASFSEFAEAIDRAAPRPPSGRPTILHLTAGWAAEAAPSLTHPLRGGTVGTDLVLRALQVAGCRGALVVGASAADPRSPSSGEAGLIYPAAWSTAVRPEPSRCRAWLSDSAELRGEGVPLVLTAAAARLVRGRPRPLSTLRAEAAPTYFAVANVPARPGRAVISGDPAAGASLSAALAWGWWMLPEGEDEVQLIRELARVAPRMGRDVKVTLPTAVTPGASQARWLRPCRFVEGACAQAACPVCPSAPAPRSFEEPKEAFLEVSSEVGRACPDNLRVTVFAAGRVPIEPYCREQSDVLRRPFARAAGSRAGCIACEGRAAAGANALELSFHLAEDAPPPSFLVFTAGGRHALHPVKDWGLAPGRSTSVRLQLPGPVPKGLKARLFFSDGRVSSAEPLELFSD